MALILASAFSSTCHAAITSTDVAIVGVYSDGSGTNVPPTGDAFAWIALNPISAGEVLYFTNSGYFSSIPGFFGEALVRYTVPTGGIAAGSIHSVETGNLPTDYIHITATTPYTQAIYSDSLALNSTGDQLLIFQDSDISNVAGFTAITALNLASSQWGGINDATNSRGSTDLYPGLTNGVNAIALGSGPGVRDEWDNVRYIGPQSSDPVVLLANIMTVSNWEQTDTAQTNYLDWVSNDNRSLLIPEPSGTALLLIGAGGLLARRRRSD